MRKPGLELYKIRSSKTNLEVLLNLDRIRNYNDFTSLPFVNWFVSNTNITFQKLWNFFTFTPILEAWKKDGKIISEFLIKNNKFRKTYGEEHIELFVNERLVTLDILPSEVFDFLEIDSPQQLRVWDHNTRVVSKNIIHCQSCHNRFLTSEIVEPLGSSSGICWYCAERLTPYERRILETPKLFRNRIDETWKLLDEKQREKIVFNILRNTRTPYKISDIHELKVISREVASENSIYNTNKLTKRELEELIKTLDRDYFIDWWSKIL